MCQSARQAFRRKISTANFNAVIDEINRVKPAGAKGRYIKKLSLSSTMGPGVKLNAGNFR